MTSTLIQGTYNFTPNKQVSLKRKNKECRIKFNIKKTIKNLKGGH
jgi:hypothetical protein